MDETIGRPARAVRWGLRVRLRLRLGVWLLSRHDRGYRPYRLPSIRALADSAGAHRNTVAAVYRDLERFGLVRCVQGKGTFATVPPDPSRMPREPLRTGADLADVLTTELGRELRPHTPLLPGPGPGRGRQPHGSGALLLPLDATPPAGDRIVPVVPRGPAIVAVSRLTPGSNVRLVSRSPSVGRLVRHTLMALHGNTVGMARTDHLPLPGRPGDPVPRNRDGSPAGRDDALTRAVAWDLTLVDAYEHWTLVSRHGTPERIWRFIPLKLVASGGPSGG